MSNELIEHTFRHEFGRIIAKLSAKYGTTNLMEIEDAVSDAMVTALKTWSLNGTPDNPSGWFYRVADRNLIDKLRRKKKFDSDIAPILKPFPQEENKQQDELHLIRLMLWCAHPALEYRDQIAMMLKLVSGFSNKEISAALLLNTETIKKRIQRAKTKIKSVENSVELPELSQVSDRFSSLRKAIYLTFNEGYFSINTSKTIREDIVYEALRLCKILTGISHENQSASFALMSLMTFHASRMESRISDKHTIVLLEDQDRSLWNRELIKIANGFLSIAMKEQRMSEYHIEACIAAVHTNSKSFADTDWKYISILYKSLSEAIPSPITKLNYAFSLLKSDNLKLSFEILSNINDEELKQQKYLYFATLSSYYMEVGNSEKGKKTLWQAIDSCDHDQIRSVLTKRLHAL